MLYGILKLCLKLNNWLYKDKHDMFTYNLSTKDTLNILDKLELINVYTKVDALNELIDEGWIAPEFKQELVDIQKELIRDPLGMLFTYVTNTEGEKVLKYEHMVYHMVITHTLKKIDFPILRAYRNILSKYNTLRYFVLWSMLKFWKKPYDIKDFRIDMIQSVMSLISYNIAGKDIKNY